MNVRLTIAAVAMIAATLTAVACADNSTGPAAPPTRYSTTESFQILNPKTGVLTEYKQGIRSVPGVSLSTTAPLPVAAIFIADNNPSVSRVGAYHLGIHTVDVKNHTHDIMYLYAGSGPPTAVQHYIDGKLATETKNTWVRVSGGWYRSLSTLQVLSPTSSKVMSSLAVVGTYTAVTAPCNPKVTECGPAQTVMNDQLPLGRRTVGYVALGLANLFAPADALAQVGVPSLFGPCTQEWITYQAAGLALAAAAVALAACPECGATEAAFAAAMFACAKAEDALLNCELRSAGYAAAGAGPGTDGGMGGGAGGGGGDYYGCGSGIVTEACVWRDMYSK
jgi:hypothetical protein